MTAQIESRSITAPAAPDVAQVQADRRKGPLLDLDRKLMLDSIGRREFALRHRITNHPLLSLEALAELADALPPAAVERLKSDQPLLAPGGGGEDSDGLPSETVRNIEHGKRWMVLWNVEQVQKYEALLDELLNEAEPLLPARERGMGRREGFIFLSAPHSITPAHFDPEHNFLLQVRGHKQIHVGRFPDSACKVRELNRFFDGGHRNLDEIPPQSSVFSLHPGDGTYIYPWAPHWVRNGPEVSVSLSITFRTRSTECFEFANAFNVHLRRRGLSARAAGESEGVDRTKAAVVALWRWARRHGRPQRGNRDYR